MSVKKMAATERVGFLFLDMSKVTTQPVKVVKITFTGLNQQPNQ